MTEVMNRSMTDDGMLGLRLNIGITCILSLLYQYKLIYLWCSYIVDEMPLTF